MKVFDTIPCGEPPLAPFAKSSTAWRRSEFEGSLRQWFRFMVVRDQEHANSIRGDWQETFEKLPPNDDPNLLPPELKPKWRELRTQAARAPPAASDTSVLDGVSSMLENPPINPLTGADRTPAEREREKEAYKVCVRRMTPRGRNFAVFQGDYLFVKLPSKPLFLARVVHDCCIDDAIAPEITFTIGAYEHIPQERVEGLLGTFTKKPNEAYNPHDKTLGGKFVRHANITRDEVSQA
jgi:hypothetical protein